MDDACWCGGGVVVNDDEDSSSLSSMSVIFDLRPFDSHGTLIRHIALANLLIRNG